MSDSLRPHGLQTPEACQAPLSTGFSRQEYWSGLPFPPPRAFPHPGIELMSPTFPALADGFFTVGLPGKLFGCSYVLFHGCMLGCRVKKSKNNQRLSIHLL